MPPPAAEVVAPVANGTNGSSAEEGESGVEAGGSSGVEQPYQGKVSDYLDLS